MRIAEQVDLGEGRSVTVRELTVAEIRAWLAEGEREGTYSNISPSDQIIGALYFDDILFVDIIRMTDITRQDLDQMRPSDLAPVVEVCKRLNAPFFRILNTLKKAGAWKRLQDVMPAHAEAEESPSNAALAS